MRQHADLYRAIMEGRADDARRCASDHLHYVQQVLSDAQLEVERTARARRRQALA
jgi:GntR family transcriptional repressor for pyruvate dehydrogenase complex